MTQMFDDKGEVRPITVLQAGPCVVTQVRNPGRDGYEAVQVGLVEFVKGSRVSKAMQGHFSKGNVPPVKFLREFDVVLDGDSQPKQAQEGEPPAANGLPKVGDKVLVDIFTEDKFVDVTGTSKGRGFAGVVKRHKFGGGAKSHGSMFQISGSIGSSSFPSRVFKGMRMAGHMGQQRVTVRNLRIVGIDLEENLLMVEGAVPGPRNSYVTISKAKKPPRERRGFAGETTINPLKASKKAAGGGKKSK
jgi:large subunit ribosomal protein L3